MSQYLIWSACLFLPYSPLPLLLDRILAALPAMAGHHRHLIRTIAATAAASRAEVVIQYVLEREVLGISATVASICTCTKDDNIQPLERISKRLP